MSSEPTTQDSDITTITVNRTALPRTLARLQALGAVMLGFSVRGSTYTLNVVLPPAGELERAIEEGEA